MESEFFGHRRGAFTGAHEERSGFFQAAHNGTLFLDEVAELPPSIQVKLLRALQERSVRKLGGQREEAVDVHIVSATNRDLSEAVRRGEFRQDLYYRLQVIELRIPPLRDRREDIPMLSETILHRLAGARQPSLSADAMAQLGAYDFPGNVRELENILGRALAMAPDQTIDAADLQFEPALQQTASAALLGARQGNASDALPLCLPAYLRGVEQSLLMRALRQARFHRAQAAQLLGISLRQLRYRMQRLSIDEYD